MEKNWLREAILSWDKTTDAINFVETSDRNAELVIGWVTLRDQPSSVWGYWNALWDTNKIRYRATIKLREGEPFYETREGFIHGVQHELGNVLGLGDLNSTSDYVSVLEDPWQPPFGNTTLSDFDFGLIRQLHGESTCPDSWNKQVSASPSPSA